MVIAFPWSGRDWNRVVAISGRAAMPGLPGGSGFNWRSVAGTTGMMRPRGMGRLRRRGMGQDMEDYSGGPIDTSGGGIDWNATPTDVFGSFTGSVNTGSAFPQTSSVSPSVAAQGGSSSSSTAFWEKLLGSAFNVGAQITSYELNPLTNKSTYIRTPQGGIIATNSPTGATGLTTGLTSGSMMPLLLMGGGLVLVMMMAKR